MIVELICNIFFWIVNLFVSIIPTFPNFAELNMDLSPLFSVLSYANMFVSLKTVGFCVILVLIVYNIKFIWSIFMWLVRKIPGVS